LWVVAVLSLGFYAWVQLDARLLALGLDAPRLTGRAAARILGRLEIERLGVSAVVLEGAGPGTLLRGVGHIPGTALPRDPVGNVGIAGHRDTFFRALSGVQSDDVIELTTPQGTFRYRVDWARVVAPEQIEVLAPTGEPAVTLVTCYPFRYIGPAPRRFVVRGKRI
jgi:sortase A